MMMSPERLSLVCRIIYAAVALANVAIFFYWRGDFNNIMIAFLLVMFIFNQRLIDMWREAAGNWRDAANGWQETSAAWKAVAEKWKSEKWN